MSRSRFRVEVQTIHKLQQIRSHAQRESPDRHSLQKRHVQVPANSHRLFSAVGTFEGYGFHRVLIQPASQSCPIGTGIGVAVGTGVSVTDMDVTVGSTVTTISVGVSVGSSVSVN